MLKERPPKVEGSKTKTQQHLGGGGDCLEVINPPPHRSLNQRLWPREPISNNALLGLRTVLQTLPTFLCYTLVLHSCVTPLCYFLVLHSCIEFLCYPLLCYSLVLLYCVTLLCHPLVCVQSVFHVWCSCPMGGCWRSVTRRMAIGRRLVRPPSPSPTVGQRLWRGWCWDTRPISGNTNVRIVSKLCWPCVCVCECVSLDNGSLRDNR